MKFIKDKKLMVLVIILILIAGVYVWIRISLNNIPLKVVKTVPDNGIVYSPFLPITFYFNRVPKQNEVAVDIEPASNIKTVISSSDNSLQIIPQSYLSPQTTYRITVSTKPQFTLTFITEQTVSNTPDWNQSFDQAFQQYQQQYGVQDAALGNIRKSAPLKEDGFTVNYSYADNTYTIDLFAPYDQNKQNFLAWLNQQGITDVSLLRIKYINQ